MILTILSDLGTIFKMMSNHSLMSVVSPFLALLILTTNNAAYLMLKHGFPPTKWIDLATALRQGHAVESITADFVMSRLNQW